MELRPGKSPCLLSGGQVVAFLIISSFPTRCQQPSLCYFPGEVCPLSGNARIGRLPPSEKGKENKGRQRVPPCTSRQPQSLPDIVASGCGDSCCRALRPQAPREISRQRSPCSLVISIIFAFYLFLHQLSSYSLSCTSRSCVYSWERNPKLLPEQLLSQTPR